MATGSDDWQGLFGFLFLAICGAGYLFYDDYTRPNIQKEHFILTWPKEDGGLHMNVYGNAIERFYRNHDMTQYGAYGVATAFNRVSGDDLPNRRKADFQRNYFACAVRKGVGEKIIGDKLVWDSIGRAIDYASDTEKHEGPEFDKGWRAVSLMSYEAFTKWYLDPENTQIKPLRKCWEDAKTVDFTEDLPFPLRLP